jgi:hypothetical protein
MNPINIKKDQYQIFSLKISALGFFKTLILALLCFSSVAHAEFSKIVDYKNDGVDKSIWSIPKGTDLYHGPTQSRADYPSVSNGSLHLILDTFNPVGTGFYGSEIMTPGIAVGSGLFFEIQGRMVNPDSKGLVAGMFFKNVVASAKLNNEIDFDLLGNLPTLVYSSLFTNEPISAGRPQYNNILNFNITQTNTYAIAWLPDSVRWYVNNKLVREETTNIPNGQLAFHLGLWVPDCYWAEACPSNLLPATRVEDNQRFQFDVDWVRALGDVSTETLCLFNWAEQAHPEFFSPAYAFTRHDDPYTYRKYENTGYSLGVRSTDKQVVTWDKINGIVERGTLSYWLKQASCPTTP